MPVLLTAPANDERVDEVAPADGAPQPADSVAPAWSSEIDVAAPEDMTDAVTVVATSGLTPSATAAEPGEAKAAPAKAKAAPAKGKAAPTRTKTAIAPAKAKAIAPAKAKAAPAKAKGAVAPKSKAIAPAKAKVAPAKAKVAVAPAETTEPAAAKATNAPLKTKVAPAPTEAKAAPAPAKVTVHTANANTEPLLVPAQVTAGTAPAKVKAAATFVAWCPSCAIPLEPAPTSSRRCAQCRQRIIVKRVDGRTVLLAEAVLPVFEAERRRVANASRLARECQRWLRLAALAGAPAERVEARALAAVARPSDEAVAASRLLYLRAVEGAYQDARREHRWDDASRIRRDHALVMHRVAGSPVPPSEEVLRLHREAMAATLRGIAEFIRDAELVAGTCCDVCRADDRRIVRISAELRAPSLPHEACPKGLCGCRWDLPTRRRATVPRSASQGSSADPRRPRAKASPAT